ncbi:MAG: corrinoid protein [bacterium]
MLSRAQAMTQTEKIIKDALDNNIPAISILNEGLVPAMSIIGDKFSESEIYIPDVLIAARAMQFGMDILRPLLTDDKATYRGTVVIGTVKGDLHDIGKNLVKYMLQGGGFNVIDLGNDVSPEKFIDAVRVHNPQIIAMSALLTTTMGSMKDVIDATEEAGIRDRLKIMIGGAPVTQEFADKIKADGYAKDAGSAIHKAIELLGIQ